LRPEQFFASISHRILARWLKHHMWHSLHILHNKSKFGRYRSVMKGTSLFRPKDFSVAISPRTGAESPKHHTWHSLPIRHEKGKTGRYRAVMEGSLLLRSERFFHHYLALLSGEVAKLSHVARPAHARLRVESIRCDVSVTSLQ
jgi:hypothetical protein